MNGKLDGGDLPSNLNTGAYQKLENEIADWADLGMEATLDVRVAGYVDGRTTGFEVELSVIDPDTGRRLRYNDKSLENAPSQEYSRRTRVDIIRSIEQQIEE